MREDLSYDDVKTAINEAVDNEFEKGYAGIPVVTWKDAFKEFPVIMSFLFSVVGLASAGMVYLAFAG